MFIGKNNGGGYGKTEPSLIQPHSSMCKCTVEANIYNQCTARASQLKIESCVDHVLEHRQFFASCLGHQGGVALLMMTSRVLLHGLDHAIVWNECNHKTPMAMLARFAHAQSCTKTKGRCRTFRLCHQSSCARTPFKSLCR